MEIGEVDLNYVLQQQAKLLDRKGTSGSSNYNSESRYSFNMNFVRLTWQQMLSAVYSIHKEHGIVHGDLKPANFLFVKGALKLIDFGIAKAIPTDENTTNIYRDSQVGTLNYMSPEAIMGTTCGGDGGGMKMKLGRASDIWSLGCILYQMVYGEYHMIKEPFSFRFYFI
jgi:serine/threonine-protein kinase TTK/MPS1